MIKIVETEEEKNAAFQVRKDVFVEEQHVPVEIEIDEFDEHAIHFICYNKNKPIGASRLRFVGNYGKLERICVLKTYRGQSIGKQLIVKMEEEIKHQGYQHAKLNAQTHAVSFYQRLGYQVTSEEFMDAGIPHVTMEKQLVTKKKVV